MQLDQRDLSVIQLISRFKQLTSQHITSLVFYELSSHTPADRTLRRLVDRRYLARIERRTVGGARGGSGQFVYQLGPEGHRLFHEGRWIPARAISYHSLAIADVYVMLHRLQRQGSLVIKGYMTEPDCHLEIGRYYLKPDLYAELERPDGSNHIRFMFEIDRGTQGRRQITEKLVRYWNAWEVTVGVDDDGEDVFAIPRDTLVVFIAIDDHRADELKWLLDRGDKEQQAIFRVRTIQQLEAELT